MVYRRRHRILAVCQQSGVYGGAGHGSVFAELLMITGERITVDTWVLSSLPSCLSPACPPTVSLLFARPLWLSLCRIPLYANAFAFCHIRYVPQTAPIIRWDWDWETINFRLAVLNVSPLWEIIYHFLNNIWQRQLFWTQSLWIMCLGPKRNKRGSQKNSFAYLHKQMGCGTLVVISASTVRLQLIWTGSENVAALVAFLRSGSYETLQGTCWMQWLI